MKKLTIVIFLFLYTVNIFGQKTDKTLSPKQQLENAIAKSKKEKNIRRVIEITIQNKDILSTFAYSAPDKFYLLEKVSGKVVKEAVEIAKQRYQKKDEQWIKTRLDYVPLRDQWEDFFPVKLCSKKKDAIEVKNSKVDFPGEEKMNENAYLKYEFAVTYVDLDYTDQGTAWINKNSRLLERVETKTVGLFGPVKSFWNYYYNEEINIEAPKDFIERDWVN